MSEEGSDSRALLAPEIGNAFANLLIFPFSALILFMSPPTVPPLRKYRTAHAAAPIPTMPRATLPMIMDVVEPLDIIDVAKPRSPPPVEFEPTDG